jgi:DNA-binding LytR/AlgR family response regulator
MNILVVEDEKPASDRLVKMLLDRPEEINIVAVLDTVASAVEFLQTATQPDLIFLDIQLGDGKSFEIFEHVEVTSHIVFTTAFDQYAIQAFKYNSIDYLLKPLKKDELDFAFAKYKNQTSTPSPAVDFSDLLKHFKTTAEKEYKSRFLVKKGSRLLSVETDKVALIYTKDRIHYLKTFEGEDFFVDGNLDELELQLDPAHFFRANRQFILNYRSVGSVFAWFDGKLKLETQPKAFEDIVVSRLRANAFKKWLGK